MSKSQPLHILEERSPSASGHCQGSRYGARENADSLARRAVESCLDLATLGEERPGWKLGSGHLVTASMAGCGETPVKGGARGPSSGLQISAGLRLAELRIRVWFEAWEAPERREQREAVDLARWERRFRYPRMSLLSRRSHPQFRGERCPRHVCRSGTRRWLAATVTYYLKDYMVLVDHSGGPRVVCFHTSSSPRSRPISADIEEDITIPRFTDFYNAIRALVGEEKVTLPAQLIENMEPISELMPPGSFRRRILESSHGDGEPRGRQTMAG